MRQPRMVAVWCPTTVFTGLVGAAVLAALSACARLAEPTPTDRTAVVAASPWGKVYRGGYVEIASVRGITPEWRVHTAMQIPEGDQSAILYVYLCAEDPQHCVSVAQAQVAFHAQAGQTYRARAQEQVNGSNRFWVWLEDERTGKVAGGNPPPTPAS